MALQINRILFPTDFSKTSENALTFALEIAKLAKASLSIAHTIEEPYDYAPILEEYKHQVSRKVETLFKEQLEDIAEDSRYGDLEIDTRILSGRTVLAILDEADKLSADLIVMGTTGASGMKKVLFGSNATEVILNSKVPVLAIPENSTFKGLKHITFLTDYNDGDLNALKKTAGLGKLFNSDISVVHVEMETDLKTEIMHRGFKDIASKHVPYSSMEFELIIEQSLSRGITEFLETHPASMLTMVRYQKPFFTKLLNKNHSKELGFYTEVPLLVLTGDESSV